MRHIFIGDVHGMDKALEGCEQVAPTTEDQIIFVGDLVDKGPNSAGVVRRARELSQTQNVVLVLGNHEDTHARYRKHLVNLPKTAEEMAKNKPHLPIITAVLTDAGVAFLDTAILVHRVPEHNILLYTVEYLGVCERFRRLWNRSTRCPVASANALRRFYALDSSMQTVGT